MYTCVVERLEQQHFHGSPAGTRQMQTSRYHLGVVYHKNIAVAQELRQVAYDGIVRSRRAPVDQQSRRVARFNRRLGNQLVWQRVVDVRELHAVGGA